MVLEKNPSERIKPQQVKNNMQQFVVKKHVRDDCPWPQYELTEGSRQGEPVYIGKIFISTQQINYRCQPDNNPDSEVDIYQLR